MFGGSSLRPLWYVEDQQNVPREATVPSGLATVPGETLAETRAVLDGLLAECVEPGIGVDLRLHSYRLRSYTGHEEAVDHELPPFYRSPGDAIFDAAQRAAEAAVAHAVPAGVWAFCTDGGYLAQAGVPCVGYGPGDEHMAHVLDEHIAIDEIVEAAAAYMGLALEMGRARR